MIPDFSELVAPKGKYRVIGIDKFRPPGEGHWIVGDYDGLEEALDLARRRTREAIPNSTSPSIAEVYYVYDDRGCYCGGDVYSGE
jgi:hypothetical protein